MIRSKIGMGLLAAVLASCENSPCPEVESYAKGNDEVVYHEINYRPSKSVLVKTPNPSCATSLQELCLPFPETITANGITANLIRTLNIVGGEVTHYTERVAFKSNNDPGWLFMPITLNDKIAGTIRFHESEIGKYLSPSGTIPHAIAIHNFTPTHDFEVVLAGLSQHAMQNGLSDSTVTFGGQYTK